MIKLMIIYINRLKKIMPKYNFRPYPKKLLEKKKFRNFFKEVIKYYFYYKLPSLLGDVIDLFVTNKISKKYSFIRADCDHFGSWIFLILYIRQNNDPKRKYICLAKKESIDNYWLELFLKNTETSIIYNKILQFLITPFFFSSKLAVEVNGHTFYSFPQNIYSKKTYKMLDVLNSEFLDKYAFNDFKKKNKFSILNLNKVLPKDYVLFYARTGKWKHSISNSLRNMPPKVIYKLINLISSLSNVVLIDEIPLNNQIKSNNIYSLNELSEKNLELVDIYSNSSCVIGSISGATHFPSLLFNKPTLYIGDMPFDHLDAIYMPPYKNKMFEQSIPIKDQWIFIKNNNLETLSEITLHKIIYQFISKKRLNSIDEFCSYKYDHVEGNFRRQLIHEKVGNIHIHKDFYH